MSETELGKAEMEALRVLLKKRAEATFIGMEDARAETEAMIARKDHQRDMLRRLLE